MVVLLIVIFNNNDNDDGSDGSAWWMMILEGEQNFKKGGSDPSAHYDVMALKVLLFEDLGDNPWKHLKTLHILIFRKK